MKVLFFVEGMVMSRLRDDRVLQYRAVSPPLLCFCGLVVTPLSYRAI